MGRLYSHDHRENPKDNLRMPALSEFGKGWQMAQSEYDWMTWLDPLDRGLGAREPSMSMWSSRAPRRIHFACVEGKRRSRSAIGRGEGNDAAGMVTV